MENMATYGEQKKIKVETCSTIEMSDMLQRI